MSGRQWKPGDVAVVRNEHDVWNIAIYVVGLGWQYGVSQSTAGDDAPARPLVVIDPEDREQISIIRDALDPSQAWKPLAQWQDALRTLVAQSKPPEPGRYGVVVAGDGREWFRWTTSERRGRDWCRASTGDSEVAFARWEDLYVIRIVHEGVTP